MKVLILLGLFGLGVVLAEETILLYYHENVGIPEAARIKHVEQAMDFDGRIVGGSPAAVGTYPFLVGLVITLTTGGSSVCGSSMLSNTRAVTAAHCWWDGRNRARQFTLVFGSARLFSGGTRVVTSNVAMHGSYNTNTLSNDVAVISFSHVAYTNVINRIALPSGSLLNSNFAGASAQAAGYGRTTAGISQNQVQSHVTLQVVNNAVCQQAFGSMILASTLCTSGSNGRNRRHLFWFHPRLSGGHAGRVRESDVIRLLDSGAALNANERRRSSNKFGLGVVLAEETILLYYHENVGIPEAARIKHVEQAMDFDGRIVGGSPAAVGTYPFLVGLVITLTSGGTSVCGSSMLSNTRAITAAHCWWDGRNRARQFTLVFGSARLFSGGTRVVSSSVAMHGYYDTETLSNDVAIIRFSHVAYTISGIYLNQVQSHVTLQVINNAVCQQAYGSMVLASTLCTSGDNGRSTCSGDSGGPLTITSGGQRVLVLTKSVFISR
ncbi:Serine protease, partial [Operophtera brumata]